MSVQNKKKKQANTDAELEHNNQEKQICEQAIENAKQEKKAANDASKTLKKEINKNI